MKKFVALMSLVVCLSASPCFASSISSMASTLGFSYNNHTTGNISNMMYNLSHSMDDYFASFWEALGF